MIPLHALRSYELTALDQESDQDTSVIPHLCLSVFALQIC